MCNFSHLAMFSKGFFTLATVVSIHTTPSEAVEAKRMVSCKDTAVYFSWKMQNPAFWSLTTRAQTSKYHSCIRFDDKCNAKSLQNPFLDAGSLN